MTFNSLLPMASLSPGALSKSTLAEGVSSISDEVTGAAGSADHSTAMGGSSSSGDDSDSVDYEGESDELTLRMETLEKTLHKSPYALDVCLQLIEGYVALGCPDKVKYFREHAACFCPTTEEFWMAWIADERDAATIGGTTNPPTSESIINEKQVLHLYRRAVTACPTADLWVAYFKYLRQRRAVVLSLAAIGDESGEGGGGGGGFNQQHLPPGLTASAIRRAYESALRDLGLHVTEGPKIWASYRQFEMHLLTDTLNRKTGGTELCCRASAFVSPSTSSPSDIVSASDLGGVGSTAWKIDMKYRSGSDLLRTEGSLEPPQLIDSGSNEPLLVQSKELSQVNRIRGLFGRQMSLPLTGLPDLMDEYRIFEAELPKSSAATPEQLAWIDACHEKGVAAWDKRKPFELKVMMTDDDCVGSLQRLSEGWTEYIAFEKSVGDAERVFVTYLRACDDLGHIRVDLWFGWTDWIVEEMKDFNRALTVYERAVRYHPTNAKLWMNYFLCQMQRCPSDPDRIRSTFGRSLRGLDSERRPQELVDVALTCADCVRRSLKSIEEDQGQRADRLRSGEQGGVGLLSVGSVSSGRSASPSREGSTASATEPLERDSKMGGPRVLGPLEAVREIFEKTEQTLLQHLRAIWDLIGPPESETHQARSDAEGPTATTTNTTYHTNHSSGKAGPSYCQSSSDIAMMDVDQQHSAGQSVEAPSGPQQRNRLSRDRSSRTSRSNSHASSSALLFEGGAVRSRQATQELLFAAMRKLWHTWARQEAQCSRSIKPLQKIISRLLVCHSPATLYASISKDDSGSQGKADEINSNRQQQQQSSPTPVSSMHTPAVIRANLWAPKQDLCNTSATWLSAITLVNDFFTSALYGQQPILTPSSHHQQQHLSTMGTHTTSSQGRDCPVSTSADSDGGAEKPEGAAKRDQQGGSSRPFDSNATAPQSVTNRSLPATFSLADRYTVVSGLFALARAHVTDDLGAIEAEWLHFEREYGTPDSYRQALRKSQEAKGATVDTYNGGHSSNGRDSSSQGGSGSNSDSASNIIRVTLNQLRFRREKRRRRLSESEADTPSDTSSDSGHFPTSMSLAWHTKKRLCGASAAGGGASSASAAAPPNSPLLSSVPHFSRTSHGAGGGGSSGGGGGGSGANGARGVDFGGGGGEMRVRSRSRSPSPSRHFSSPLGGLSEAGPSTPGLRQQLPQPSSGGPIPTAGEVPGAVFGVQRRPSLLSVPQGANSTLTSAAEISEEPMEKLLREGSQSFSRGHAMGHAGGSSASVAEADALEFLTRATWDGHESSDPSTAPPVPPITSSMSPIRRRSNSLTSPIGVLLSRPESLASPPPPDISMPPPLFTPKRHHLSSSRSAGGSSDAAPTVASTSTSALLSSPLASPSTRQRSPPRAEDRKFVGSCSHGSHLESLNDSPPQTPLPPSISAAASTTRPSESHAGRRNNEGSGHRRLASGARDGRGAGVALGATKRPEAPEGDIPMPMKRRQRVQSSSSSGGKEEDFAESGHSARGGDDGHGKQAGGTGGDAVLQDESSSNGSLETAGDNHQSSASGDAEKKLSDQSNNNKLVDGKARVGKHYRQTVRVSTSTDGLCPMEDDCEAAEGYSAMSVSNGSQAIPVDLLGCPEESSTVFVSHIDNSVNEEKLKEVFSGCAGLKEVRIVRDFMRRSKGFAYIDFSTAAEAAEAASKTDGTVLNDRAMKCQVSRPSVPIYEPRTVFLTKLPPDVKEEEITAMFENQGHKASNVRLVRDNAGHCRGYGYLDCESEKSVAAILSLPASNWVLQLSGCQVTVAPSIPMKRHRWTTAPENKSEKLRKKELAQSEKERPKTEPRTLFVKNLSFKTNEDTLKKHFATMGDLEEVMVCRDTATGKSKGFGFVRYAKDSDAFSGLMLDNSTLDSREISVSQSFRAPTAPKLKDDNESGREKAPRSSNRSAGPQPIREGDTNVTTGRGDLMTKPSKRLGLSPTKGGAESAESEAAKEVVSGPPVCSNAEFRKLLLEQ